MPRPNQYKLLLGLLYMIDGLIRHEAIMLQKLSIMLLSSVPKITCYAFLKMPIILKIMPLI